MKNLNWKDIPLPIKILIWIIVAALIYWLASAIIGAAKKGKTALELQAEQQTYQNAGQSLSYGTSQYQVFANTLENADGFFDDDEDAIYYVFGKMNNDLDIIELEKQYMASFSRSMTDFLVDVFNRNEINQVNGILMSKGINRAY